MQQRPPTEARSELERLERILLSAEGQKQSALKNLIREMVRMERRLRKIEAGLAATTTE